MRVVIILAVLATAGLLLLLGGEPDPIRTTGAPTPRPSEPVAAVIHDGTKGRVVDEDGRFVLATGSRSATVRARGGTLAGTVRDAEGRPVPGAGVRSGRVEAEADAAGRYALADLKPGFLGAMDVRAPQGAWQALVRLPEAPVRADATSEFDPVVEAGVSVSGTAPPGATVLLQKDRARTQADTQGRFRFDGVLPDRYGVQLDPGIYQPIAVGEQGLAGIELAAPGFATLEVTGAGDSATLMVFGNTWHAEPDSAGRLLFERVLAPSRPSVRVGSESYGPIELRPGEKTVYAIPLPRLIFAGVVEDPDGEPLRGADVRVYDEAAEMSTFRYAREEPTDASGQFRFEIRSDARKFAIVASHFDFTPAVRRRLDATAESVRLRLGVGVALEGTVVFDDGEPAPRAWIGAYGEDQRWRLGGHSDDRTVGDYLDAGLRPSRTTRAGENGRFRIEGLVPGRYWVTADHPEGGWFETDGPPLRLTIEREIGESIAGILVDARGKRVSGAIVRAGVRGATSDQAGRFRIHGLADGVHDLVAKPQEGGIGMGEYFAPTTLRGVEAGRDDVVMRIGDGRSMRGRILDPAGRPVAGANVKLLPPPPPQDPGIGTMPNTPETNTDAEGRYTLRALPEGPLELVVFRTGLLPAVFEARGDTADDQRLSPGESVSGVLLDREGRPAPQRALKLSILKAAREADLLAWRRDWQQYGPWFRSRTGADGAFNFTGLPAGEYQLELGAGKDLTPIKVSSGTSGLELKLLPLLTITGVVVDENGAPVCKSGHRRLKISADHASGPVDYIPVADDGRFRFDSVPVGRIRLSVIG